VEAGNSTTLDTRPAHQLSQLNHSRRRFVRDHRDWTELPSLVSPTQGPKAVKTLAKKKQQVGENVAMLVIVPYMHTHLDLAESTMGTVASLLRTTLSQSPPSRTRQAPEIELRSPEERTTKEPKEPPNLRVFPASPRWWGQPRHQFEALEERPLRNRAIPQLLQVSTQISSHLPVHVCVADLATVDISVDEGQQRQVNK